jgi:hypothetical protein
MEKATPVSDIKKIVGQLLNNFLTEEHGNRVTKNNMFALATQINQTFEGQITLTPPTPEGEDKSDKE